MSVLSSSICVVVSICAPAISRASQEAILPPAPPWDGLGRELVVANDDPWITPSEKSGLTRSPSYDETVAWVRRLVDAAPELALTSLGKSPEGRDIWMVIASKEQRFTSEEMKAGGKPRVLAQAGIHSGEIDGKDAGLMLLRDLTVRGTKAAWLDGVDFLFVPILSVDGHERRSKYGRINQRGPIEMGWRTNARNLNLNRDYAKLDTPELRAMIRALCEWEPDLYLDLHVTDGVDYQYDITFGWNGPHAWSEAIGGWLDEHYRPYVSADLETQGHVPGPLIFAVDNKDVTRGIVDWTASPRFSNGYGAARHLPTILVENHSLKPYDQRVLGTYVLLESTLRLAAKEGESLRAAVASDRAKRPEEVPLSWRRREGDPEMMAFKGIVSRVEPSEVSGGSKVVWTGEPVDQEVPFLRIDSLSAATSRPKAYWISPSWPEVIERLEVHGIELTRTTSPRTLEVEMDRYAESKLADDAFEGRVRISGTPVPEKRVVTMPAGSVRVATDQTLGTLAVLLLDPRSPDSFWQWGFFAEVLQRTEYVEGYVMEPMAERMLAEDAELRAEFEKKLAEDEEFAQNPRERLQWFYRRTPFYDDRHDLYPVARELEGE